MDDRITKCGSQPSIKRASWKAWLHFTSALFIALNAYAQEPINFEQLFSSDIVVESKQLQVPGYPLAFNPSIIRFRDHFILSFRVIPERKDNMTSYLGVIRLNADFVPTGEPVMLNLRAHSKVKSRAEDGRLVAVGDRLWMVFSDNDEPKITKGGFRVYVVEIRIDRDELVLSKPECLNDFEFNNPHRREKNWVPFAYEGHLYLAYSLSPHVILRPLLDGSGKCETVAASDVKVAWDFGELRGGTPAFLQGDTYLSFFHSSMRVASSHSAGIDRSHYFMGAYTFEREPPFRLTAMSKNPVVGDGFYGGELFKGYWKPVRAVYPGGYVWDEHYLWVAYGKDDHQLWITKLDKKALMKSLVPLQYEEIESP